MKKCLLLLLVVCLLPLHGLAAPNFEAIDAVVANPNVADRLILRDSPSKNGKILGRFYSGTPVLVQAEDGEWCEVSIGNLSGYMMRAYLAYELPNYDLPQLFYTAAPKKADAPIYNKASTSGKVIARAGREVYVLGDINDDWRYVKSGENYGYMRALHLNTTDMHIPLAYLSTQVELYSDHRLSKKNGLVYRAGTPVQVLDASRNGNWASIQIAGLAGAQNLPAMGGYIHQDYLNVFVWPWQMEDYTFAIGRAAQPITLTSAHSDGISASFAQGTLVSVIGQTDTLFHVVADDYQGTVPKESIQLIKDRAAANTHMQWEGFVMLAPESEKAWQFPALTRLIYEDDTQLYLEWGFGQHGETDKNDVTILRNEDLQKNLPPITGAFEITEETAAIWHFVVEEGETAVLSMENEAWHIRMESQPFTKGSYSFYLPAGTKGTLQNAAWHSQPYCLPDVKLHTCHAQWAQEKVFEGSGRFFCDWQINNNGNFYGYRAQPIPGCEESYFVISDLTCPENSRKVDLHHAENDEDSLFSPEPGQFVELKNCILYYYFGNG